MYNKFIIVIIATLSALSISSSVHAERQVENAEIPEEQLRDNINNRSEAILDIKKKDVLLDSLNMQVDDLIQLVAILDEQVDTLNACLDKKPELDYSIWPLPLLREDDSVFNVDCIKGRIVPTALKKHYDNVCLIADIDSLLDTVDNQISETKAFATKSNLSQADCNGLIQKTIEKDVKTLYEIFTTLKKSNPDSFSEMQIKHIEQLKQKYNNYSQYYEE